MAYKPTNDRILFFSVVFLTIFGLVMVYSASSVVASSQHGMSSYFFMRQLVHAALGFAFLIVVMNKDYHVWQKPKVLLVLLLCCAAVLAFVLTQPKINGAHRWLRWGFISFQPSEVAKLILLMFIAAFLHKYEDQINQPLRRLLPFGLVIAFFAGLIAIILGFIGREKVVRVGKTDYLGASHLAIVTGTIGLIIGVVFLALSFGFGPGTVSDPEKDDGLSAPAVILSVD